MKRSTKKGFTIVELVIVIAVIAILAAVLIPTFSSLIKRANLSADMQAVRTINLALQTAEAKNGKPANADQAMLIIADAGYDVATYHPLTKGYEIYWVDTVNRVILYSTTDSEVVYPDDYVKLTNDNTWHLLNESYKNAMNEDFAGIVSDDGKNFDVTKTQTAEEAGSILYAIFVQQDEKKIDKDVKVELPKEVDVSNYIWKPVKNFSGELIGAAEGTVISGVTLDESVSYSQSGVFSGGVMNDKTGEASKYNVYGFIDTVSGDAVIENITFEDFTLTQPGSDFSNAGVTSNANVLAPIGCIIPDEDGVVNVTIRNVHAKDGTIKGIGRVAGLIGYVGGFGGNDNGTLLGGSVKIENCTVNNLTIEGGLGSSGYGTAGGLIGYLVRISGLTLEIKDCKVTNTTIKGTQTASALIGLYSAESGKDRTDATANGVTSTTLSERNVYVYGTCDFETGNTCTPPTGKTYYVEAGVSYPGGANQTANYLSNALKDSVTFEAPTND